MLERCCIEDQYSQNLALLLLAADMDHCVFCAEFGTWVGALKTMITFEIDKKPYGRAVRRDDCMVMLT